MHALMQKAPGIARVLLGLIFFVFGANFFFHFLPMPPMSGPAGEFVGALFASGYVMVLVKGVETVAGALLLANRFVPLALTLLAPIIVGIAGFHLVLAPDVVTVSALLGLELYLAYVYREAFAPMLRARTEPARPMVLHAIGRSPV